MGKHRISPEGKTKDGFWAKLVIATVIVLWLSLVVGNWLGHYLVEKGFLGQNIKLSDGKMAESRPSYSPIPLRNTEGAAPVYNPRNFGSTVPIKKETPTSEASPSEEKTPTPAETTPSPEASPSLTPKPAETVSKTQKASEAPEPEKVTNTVQKTPEAPPPPPPKEERVKKEPEKPAQLPKPVETQQAETGPESLFTLQMGAFTDRGNADELAGQLKGKGYSVHTVSVKQGDKDVFKIQVGTFKDRTSAEDQQGKLRSQGFDSIIVGK
ncbi:MAG: SPOR domain-containing protein [Chloroflexi bacterium]|nr:SPOR domain-containing protein [Chloroflexota bacterium]